MGSIIREILVSGKCACNEEITSGEYVSEYEKYNKAYENLLKDLSEEGKKLLVEIDGCITQIDKIACAEKFLQGFKAGVKFVLELLED